jgi:hypothetical protein
MFRKGIFVENDAPGLINFKKFGIYTFADFFGEMVHFSYLVNHTNGNLLFYSHPALEEFYDQIKSVGGVFKNFDFNQGYRFVNEFIFNRFGASVVRMKDSNVKEFPIEVLNKTFFDPLLTQLCFADINFLKLQSKHGVFLFAPFDMTPQKLKENLKLKKELKLTEFKFILFHQFPLGERAFLTGEEL